MTEADTLDSIIHPLSSLGLVRRDYETKEQMRDRYLDPGEFAEQWNANHDGGVYSQPERERKVLNGPPASYRQLEVML